MSDLIYLNAEFDSYASFEIALKKYCQQNAVNGIPLRFNRISSAKLKPNTFKNETLTQNTIDKFVYHNKTLVCSERKKNCSKDDKTQVNCHGRITFRYDKAKKLIIVSSLYNIHTNHSMQLNPCIAARANQLQEIINVIKKLPDDALDPVQQACETIFREWGNDNAGLTIAIIPIANEDIEPNHNELAAQALATGKF